MDVIFKCPNCEQELAVDAAGAGSEIECPSCAQVIVIPEPEPSVAEASPTPMPAEHPDDVSHVVNPIAASAAAKVERHFSVPVHDGPAEVLVKKPKHTLEAAAKDLDRKVKVRTIRQTDCVEVGRDRYDDILSEFLSKVGHENVLTISPINYTYIDIGTQKLLTAYGVTVIYKS